MLWRQTEVSSQMTVEALETQAVKPTASIH